MRPIRIAGTLAAAALVALLDLHTPSPLAAPASPTPSAMPGFTPAAAVAQRAREASFDSLLRRDEMREWLKRLSARPHHVGSPYGGQNAEFMAGLLRSWGYETAIEEFQVLFPTPKLRRLELLAPTHFVASLEEPPIPGDATSKLTAEALPLYNAYSIDGDVTGELVYVNYGRPEDYEELARFGVDVRGKIVIVRYGQSWRGIKPKVAAEHGAIGCIIYSDPREDGYYAGDPYPLGGWRNERSGQRGSVADMPLYPGDPLTPGKGSTPGTPRLALKDAATLTRIPVLPIAAADALPLLRALRGEVAPEAWRGALPITYHIGAGPARVHLQLAFDWKTVPARDVIARLKGAELPDEWVVRGNHHDAWVCGATDPLSGTVCVLEEARAVSELVKRGWHPRRTMIFAIWDGEEPGLLGSTEWGEAHADELKAKAVVYLNTDSNSRGYFSAQGSPTLEAFTNQVVRDVVDPERHVDVLARLKAVSIARGTPEARKEARERADMRLPALGSGSDYTVFAHHLGIPSLNVGYGGEQEYGQYHSAYDSFDHYTRFGDPGFDYELLLAETVGRMELRLADADVLPLGFTGLGDAVDRYVGEVEKLADGMRDEIAERNRGIDEGSFVAAADPRHAYVPPARDSLVPFLNFAPLRNAAAHLHRSAQACDAVLKARVASGAPALDAATRARLDAALVACERALTRPEGLPGRPWFTGFLQAPGLYTGYSVKTLPAVREAIEQKRWSEVEPQVAATAAALEACADRIEAASAMLR